MSSRKENPLSEHFIDLDADPFIPNGWSVPEGCHQKGGHLKWDPAKVNLRFSKPQGGKVLEGNKIREEMKDRPVYNANLLDYLFANPYLIREEWKGTYVFFLGTIYHDPSGSLCVRYLYWDDCRWHWYWYWLDDGWDGDYSVAVPAR